MIHSGAGFLALRARTRVRSIILLRARDTTKIETFILGCLLA